ncbi:MAG: enhanced intracellular survival protein Eis [Caulobacteraceae bacterium]
MEIVRKLRDEDFRQFVEIAANAYPHIGLNTAEDRLRFEERLIKIQNEDEKTNSYGLFRDGQLLGGMRFHDFRMKMHSVKVDAGGLALVAVDLAHKKEKVAKGIVSYFLKHYRERNTPIVVLYPFRPDFYKNMGFGFGTKMNQYSIRPQHFPKGGSKEHIAFYGDTDKQLMLDCYARIAEKTNGMMDREEYELNNMLGIPQNNTVVYKRGGRIEGYIVFMFKKMNEDNFLKHNIVVRELLYENAEALMELMTFLNTQDDQINRVIINTQDEYFHYLLSDPRNGTDRIFSPVCHESNIQGLGIMYRVINVRGLFEAMKGHNFNNQSCRLRLNIRDNFLEENNAGLIVHFENGNARIAEDNGYEAEISMDIADFSSIVVGAVDFKALLKYGLAEISDVKYTPVVNELFRAEQKPICLTAF